MQIMIINMTIFIWVAQIYLQRLVFIIPGIQTLAIEIQRIPIKAAVFRVTWTNFLNKDPLYWLILMLQHTGSDVRISLVATIETDIINQIPRILL